MAYLHLHLKAIIESAPQDKVAWRAHEELLALPLCNGPNSSVLIRNLTRHQEQTQQNKPFPQSSIMTNKYLNCLYRALKACDLSFLFWKGCARGFCVRTDIRMWLPIVDLALSVKNLRGGCVACVPCQCVRLAAHLDVSLWVEVVVPQDDLVVFTSSGQ